MQALFLNDGVYDTHRLESVSSELVDFKMNVYRNDCSWLRATSPRPVIHWRMESFKNFAPLKRFTAESHHCAVLYVFCLVSALCLRSRELSSRGQV